MRSTRGEHDAQVEEYLLREVHDVGLVPHADSFGSSHGKPKRRTGATQNEIDRTLCSFTIKPPVTKRDSSLRSTQKGSKGSVKLLDCHVCGKQEHMNLSNAETCSICLSDIEEASDVDNSDEQIRVLPECGHGS